MPKVETQRHQEAFNYYYELGYTRNIPKVAQQFKVSEAAVKKWSRDFNWQLRVEQRDIENKPKLDQDANAAYVESVLNTKADYRRQIKERLEEDTKLDGYATALIGSTKEKIEKGELEVLSIKELVELMRAHQGSTAKKAELMKLDLLLMGEADSRIGIEGNVTFDFGGKIDGDDL